MYIIIFLVCRNACHGTLVPRETLDSVGASLSNLPLENQAFQQPLYRNTFENPNPGKYMLVDDKHMEAGKICSTFTTLHFDVQNAGTSINLMDYFQKRGRKSLLPKFGMMPV